MLLVDRINLNHLRIFEAVHRTRSMTQAASELHLTQSGISQHIKSLEESLDIKLFDRQKQKIIPTSKANTLYEKCKKGFYDLEKTLWHITGKEQRLEGLIKVGMPSEFGSNMILPIIARFLKKYEAVQVEVVFGLASEVNALILSGDLDFGYIDAFAIDKQITTETIYTEQHDLVASEKYLKGKGKPSNKISFYESLDYITYHGAEPVLQSWFRHHIKSEIPGLNIRAFIESPYGLLQLIRTHLGAGILPSHLFSSFASAYKLVALPGSNKPQNEPISVAYLSGRSHSREAMTLGDFIREEIK